MNHFALDTDTLTLYQRGHAAVCARVFAAPAGTVAVTVVTVEEQLSGWYSQVRKAKDIARLAWAYRRLAQNVRSLSQLAVLDYTEPAIRRCEQLIRMKLGVGRSDLRIAAIALEHGAIVVTRNLTDFRRIPGLQVEDWSQ